MGSVSCRTGARPDCELVARTARACAALTAPARLELLGLLAEGERGVEGLAAELGQSVPVVSHHLARLRHARLVGIRRHRRRRTYTGADRAVIGVIEAAVAAHQPRPPTLPAARRGEHA